MEIITYQDKYKQKIIDLILHIQNDEAGINLQRIAKEALPFHYKYPDRDSYLYLLKL